MEKYCFIQIDLDDNQWVYPRQWRSSYDIARSDIFLRAVENIKIHLSPYPLTLFLVGYDMKVDDKVLKIKELLNSQMRIEIANHSLSHFNNFSSLSQDEKRKEIMDSDKIIKETLGLNRIYGFRSPGYIFSNDIIEILKDNHYTYDASLLPSYFGPVLRHLNYIINKVPGKGNFGYFTNGFLPNRPVLLDKKINFFEINVSVCPGLRVPIHYSIIKSKKIYGLLSYFIKKLQHLNFIFHLSDFVTVNKAKLNYVLNLITHQRNVVLSKDIGNFV